MYQDIKTNLKVIGFIKLAGYKIIIQKQDFIYKNNTQL